MKKFVEFITSTILRNFMFGFEKAYESHVQKLTICSLQKKINCMVTKSIYTLHFKILYTSHYNRIQETFYYYILNFIGNLSLRHCKKKICVE